MGLYNECCCAVVGFIFALQKNMSFPRKRESRVVLSLYKSRKLIKKLMFIRIKKIYKLINNQ